MHILKMLVTNQKLKIRVTALVLLCAFMSLLFSFMSLLVALQDKTSNDHIPSVHAISNVLSLKRHSRDTNSITENEACEREGTSFTSFRKVTEKLHQLTCGYRDLKLQLDSWTDEFNKVAYFINEIGLNMKAAKAQIEENFQNLNLLQEQTRIRPTPADFSQAATLDRLEIKFNRSVRDVALRLHVTEVMVENVQNQFELLETTFSNLVNGANGSAFQVTRQITRSSQISVTNEFRDKIQKNSMRIDINRDALVQFRHKMSGLASDGWFNAPNGYQYFLSKNAFRTNSYLRSRRYCKNRNGDLAYAGIRNPDVFRFLWINLIGPSRHQCVWFGLSDMEQEGQWKWMDGRSASTYWTHWAVGQPGRSDNEDCAMIRAGMWMDEHCNGLRRLCSFLCERRIV